ncbi:hypothetical protein [Siminovitchia fortis]|uniref:hypothetical protein n=1 Tax=Siminovitchia fortis TaxID=254758 RepID=UPI00119F5F7E|nr:hypothetical protein [Siminovitchia fortis]
MGYELSFDLRGSRESLRVRKVWWRKVRLYFELRVEGVKDNVKVKVRDWGNKELWCVEICLWRESGVK